jgi:hypothetical protein
MAGQYRFKDINGNVVAQISSSADGTISFSGSAVDFSNASTITLGEVQMAGTASNALLLDGFDSTAFVFTSSFNTISQSISSQLNTLQTTSDSNVGRLDNLESKSSSVDISISNINSFTASNNITSLNSKTGSYATTGSNTFFGTQTYSGSVYIANDLIVQGSSSIQYISASSVSIGTNIVQLNTANPSVRYAGLSIVDSGSIGGSGSFLYDSVEDEFIFVHRGNGSNVTSSHFVLGPETYDNLGNELYLTCNILTKGTGKEHLVDSCIFDNGTTTCIKNNLVGTGTISGTTIYGSTAVCSPVGKFTSCIDVGSGTFSGQLNVIVPSGTAKIQIGNGSVSAGSYVNLMGVTAGKTWFVASNYNVGGALEFIQSTTNGGTTPSSTNIMTIQCTGNVGIGTCTPTDMIEVSSASSPRIKVTNTTNSANAGIYFNVKDSGANALQGGIYYIPGTITYLTLSGDNVASHLNVTRTGNVGIGCTTPGYILDVRDGTTGSAGGRGMRLSVCSNSAGPQFRLEYQCTGDSRNWLIGTNQEVSGDFIIRSSTIAGCDPGGVSSATRFSINKSGFVSIGGTDAGFKLDIQSPGCAGTAENVARIGNIPGTNNGLLVHRCTDNSYRYIFQSGIMCVQNTICTETMAPRFMQYNSRVIERVGGNNGTGTFSLFTNGIGTTQSSGTVFVEAIYGTPNTTAQWMYKIGGNRTISTSWSNTTGYSGSEPSIAWYDSTLCITNSNSSVYFGVTVRLHDLGNGWAATWGNLPGLT